MIKKTNFYSIRNSSIILGSFLTILLVVAIPVSVVSQTNEDPIGAASILRSGVDARALGMGGAYVAVADNYSASYWNPAGITRADAAYLGGMNYDKFGLGLNVNYLSGGMTPSKLPLTQNLSLGGLKIPLIKDFSLAGTFVGFSTNVRAADPDGNPIGEITYSERTYMGSLGFSISSLGAIGTSVKNYRFRAPKAGVNGKNATASGLGFDLGLLAEPLSNFYVGAAGFDLTGTKIKWNNTPSEPTNIAPARYATGLAYDLDLSYLPLPELIAGTTTFAGQYTFGPNIANKIRGGLEYNVSIFAVRGGVVKPLEGDLQFAAGAGLNINLLSADVAWLQNSSVEGENTSDTVILSTEFTF